MNELYQQLQAAPFVMCGPCVIESESSVMHIAEKIAGICQRLGIKGIFKASFDKANRTSVDAFPRAGAGRRTAYSGTGETKVCVTGRYRHTRDQPGSSCRTGGRRAANPCLSVPAKPICCWPQASLIVLSISRKGSSCRNGHAVSRAEGSLYWQSEDHPHRAGQQLWLWQPGSGCQKHYSDA